MGNCCLRTNKTSTPHSQIYPLAYSNGLDVLESEKFEPTSSWTELLDSISEELKHDPHFKQHTIFLQVPVCTVGKDSPVIFTSVDAIRSELLRGYPGIVIKESARHAGDGAKTSVGERSRFHNVGPDITRAVGPTVVREKRRGSHRSEESAKAHGFERKELSVGECLQEMKKYPRDYQRQLWLAELAGSFALEESDFLFSKSDVICCLIKALKTFPDQPEIQMNAYSSLLKIASVSEANCTHIVQHDGASVFRSTLLTYMGLTKLLGLALRTIKYISTSVVLAQNLSVCGLQSEVFHVLSSHPTDRELAGDCCFILGNLLTTAKSAQELVSLGAVHKIIDLFETFPEENRIMENVCRSLGCLAVFNDTCLAVARAGATQAVLKALSSRTSDISVFESGLWALACLTNAEPTCQELMSNSGIDMTVDVITNFPNEEQFQEYGSRILYNMSRFDGTLKAVSTETITWHLVKISNTYSHNVQLAEVAMVTISHIIMGNEWILRPLAKKRYVSEVVKVMTSFPENILIQEHGCRIIGNMAVQADLRRMVENDGASQSIIAAMLALDMVRDVQEVGCLALMNITADSRENKIKATHNGAVPTLIQTMRQFVLDESLVACALKALSNLTSVEEACHQLMDSDGLNLLLKSVHSFHGNAQLLADVALVLTGVSMLPGVGSDHWAAIDQLLTSIWSFGHEDADAFLNVCLALESLVKTDTGRQHFQQCQRLDIVMKAMAVCTKSALIQCTGCRIIALVSLHMEDREIMITDATLKNVVLAMELFPLDAEVQLTGCAAFACVAEKSKKLKEMCVGCGAVSVIAKAVKSHASDSNITLVAVLALGQLTPIDTRKHFKENSMACATLLSCLNNFYVNKEILLAGYQALSQSALSESNLTELSKCMEKATVVHRSEPQLKNIVRVPVAKPSVAASSLATQSVAKSSVAKSSLATPAVAKTPVTKSSVAPPTEARTTAVKSSVATPTARTTAVKSSVATLTTANTTLAKFSEATPTVAKTSAAASLATLPVATPTVDKTYVAKTSVATPSVVPLSAVKPLHTTIIRV